MLPVTGNFEQASRLQAQAAATLPTRKRLWAELVRQKVAVQAQALEDGGGPDAARLQTLARSVRSGDPDNVEAQAARLYWPRLMGADFRRDREAEGLNTALNYGYAVLRAGMSRAVVTAGLSPTLGLHHRSRLNRFAGSDPTLSGAWWARARISVLRPARSLRRLSKAASGS